MSKSTETLRAAPPARRARQGRAPRQFPAFVAMTRAAVVAQMRSIANLFFGFLFPLVFIAVFGLLGNGGGTSIKLGVAGGTDQSSPIYQALSHISAVQLSAGAQGDLDAKLRRGDLDGIIGITPAARTITTPAFPGAAGTATPVATSGTVAPSAAPQATTTTVQGYDVTLTTSNASPQSAAAAQALVQGVIDQVNLRVAGVTTPAVQLSTATVEGRKFSFIDFALPGQLGFSLLSIAIFGTAFGFVVLKRTLVLKRIFATPTRPTTIVLAQGAARLMIAILQVAVILLAGVFLFNFHLANGVTTLAEMLVVAVFGLIAFLGFGLIIAGNFNNENAMGPVVNIFTLPQFLLSGTFFSTDSFPAWLQPIANNLPLSFLNVALRKIANEGATLFDVRFQLLGILIWGVLAYIVAIRTFKWE